ncbi:helix-turn-helix transcriptional regulator [Paenibacillus hemerocallicola]|uniref:Helix-turn-helix transcriptional regulator n=1 Tax=Paenibacillus hemerocallicola TaxID=1172614 RepID=A0A5C4TFP3_9BACL|nr:helix-turn-helix domain-containing protein [Paenibacillus hemerocallicola]TNJ67612.1 helix-turn-helix transcriptional regulator [Paenibacillus hemerocallicola]
MIRLHKPRIALFWQFFAKYFVLFLIPVIVAMTFTYFFVVRLIENDAKQRNDMMMSNNAEHTDAAFTALQTSMIHLLSDSNLKSFLPVVEGSPDSHQRNEWIHSLMDQLNKLENGDFISNAYLYFTKQDLVIDSETHNDKAYYFKYNYPIGEAEKAALFPHLTGKKTMFFTRPYTIGPNPLLPATAETAQTVLSTIMSYPFNSSDPEVYLVVDVSRDIMRDRISKKEDWVTGTAIMDSEAGVVVQSGAMEIGSAKAEKEKAVSSIPSRFNESWRYVSLVDLQTLLMPARMIRMLSLVFLGFFLVLGSAVSYYLSRKLYAPILEIKTGLATYREPDGTARREGNDFDVIKRFSKLIMSENDQLSRLVSGMVPMVQEHVITKLLLGEYRDAAALDACAREVDFVYDPTAVRTVLCIEFQYYSRVTEGQTETSKSFLLAELKESILKSFPGTTLWLCHTKPDILACVVHHEPASSLDPKAAAETVKLQLQPFASYYKATIGIGSTVRTIEQLPHSYEHAIAMLRYKGLHPEAELCGEERAKENRAPWDSFLSVQEVNRIFNLCKSRDHDTLLQSVFDLLDAGKDARAYEVKYLCSDVLNTWIRAAEDDRNDFSIAFYSRLFDMLNRCVTGDEIRQCFRDIHALMFRTTEPYDRGRQFAEILQYIHDHYAEELSIERFAQQMNMSVGHFSRTFKEEVGEKYVEYIAKVRMGKAKQYLLETDLKIDEIAEKVGYWGRNSFIPIFRKYEGITPAKYRTIYQR